MQYNQGSLEFAGMLISAQATCSSIHDFGCKNVMSLFFGKKLDPNSTNVVDVITFWNMVMAQA